MVKKIANYLWSLRKEFIKYFVVGFSGLFLDIGSLVLFKEIFGFRPVIAVIVNQIFVLTYNFTLNKYWSFRNRIMPHKQLLRYGMIVAWNYVFSVAAMYVFNESLGYDYRIVRISSIAFMVSWNFFLYKYWVYVKKPGDVL